MNTPSGKNILILIFSLASFLVPFTVSSLNVALPAIGKAFGLDALSLGWITTAYMLAAATCILPFGKLADIYGRKKVFLIGNLLFAAGSLLAGISVSGTMIIGSRVIQGLGGAMVFATSIAILTAVFSPGERGRAIGIVTASVYAGLSLGPVIGGFLTQHLGWQAIFLINIPVALMVVALTIRYIPAEWKGTGDISLDSIGVVLYGVMLSSGMYGISLLPSWTGMFGVGISLVSGVLFIRWEQGREVPFIDISAFRENRTFILSNVSAMINYSVVFAVGFLLSLSLQYNRGLDPTTTGLILLAQPVIQTIVSPIAGNLSDTTEPGLIATAGMICTAAGLLILAGSVASAPLLVIIIGLAILGLGYGLFSSPNTNAIMSSVEVRHLGVASGMVATMRSIGQILSLAITMMIFSVFIGTVQITPEVYEQLLQSTILILVIFFGISLIGVYTSFVRGTVTR